jgi:death on curing protein
VTDYLKLSEVMLMHHMLIEKHGGAHGIRDPGALDAALYRPQSGYYADVIAEAAALFESMAMNHPFVDGNKRIAFACVDVFLNLNGFEIPTKSMTVHKWMIAHLEAGTFRLEHIEPWLRRNVRPI